ncbi:MAG: hypothetical protein ACRDMX_16120 [Solirubrobacteraceae bacterium]
MLETEIGDARAGMRRLVGAGLLRCERPAVGVEEVYRITQAGLDRLGSELAPPPYSPSWRHAVGVSWVWVRAARGHFGPIERVYTEREMRALDARPGSHERPEGAFAVPVGNASQQPRQHYPDLVIVVRSGAAAVELQLAPIRRQELEAIIDGYVTHAATRATIYQVADPAIARLIAEVRQACANPDRILIQPVRPPMSAPSYTRDAPPGDRVPDRAVLPEG